ncbi:MAG: transketolase [Chlamydiia bacterium]|nr:transketolase [Chlamydiia bacterium]
MRNAFADEIGQLAGSDSRIVLLSGDIGNRLFEPFKTKFSNRFFNCGVAEANMASVAAGMAMCGLRPITYTITPFNTTRCLEQIRDDICYHQVPVLIVGTGAGLSYASLGCTHHSCEDIAFLRTIPNMTVLCPADALELRALLRASLNWPGPMYMRIGKTGEPQIYSSVPEIAIGKGSWIQKGTEICILSTGNMLSVAMEASKLLKEPPAIISMHTVKPLDTELLQDISHRFSLLVTLEEHSLMGGFGSAVAEWLVDQSITTPLLRIGTQDRFPHPIGSQKYIREQFGLTPQAIANRIEQKIGFYANTSSHPR